eukprot:s4863_g4.t1
MRLAPGEAALVCDRPEHGPWKVKQLVQLQGLQSAPELNGRLGRLQKFDVHAERWEVEVRGDGGGTKRLKEANLTAFVPPVVAAGLTVAELKERGNECFKASQLEEAIAFYSAALETAEKA